MRRRNRREDDIKAPDGFLLGGIRKVRPDGTILFQRGWWKCPDEWIGEKVWIHENGVGDVDAAPPGEHIYASRMAQTAIQLQRTDRRDAKPGYRHPNHVAWANQ